jgi:hypothetical protein
MERAARARSTLAQPTDGDATPQAPRSTVSLASPAQQLNGERVRLTHPRNATGRPGARGRTARIHVAEVRAHPESPTRGEFAVRTGARARAIRRRLSPPARKVIVAVRERLYVPRIVACFRGNQNREGPLRRVRACTTPSTIPVRHVYRQHRYVAVRSRLSRGRLR